MSDFRPELSSKSPYYISRHRFYELKHFCLQYPEWKKQLILLDSPPTSSYLTRLQRSIDVKRPTERIAILKTALNGNLRAVEEAAKATDEALWPYILKAVTEGCGFTYLKTTMDMPCERDMYYDRYRKFFWILDKYRT